MHVREAGAVGDVGERVRAPRQLEPRLRARWSPGRPRRRRARACPRRRAAPRGPAATRSRRRSRDRLLGLDGRGGGAERVAVGLVRAAELLEAAVLVREALREAFEVEVEHGSARSSAPARVPRARRRAAATTRSTARSAAGRSCNQPAGGGEGSFPSAASSTAASAAASVSSDDRSPCSAVRSAAATRTSSAVPASRSAAAASRATSAAPAAARGATRRASVRAAAVGRREPAGRCRAAERCRAAPGCRLRGIRNAADAPRPGPARRGRRVVRPRRPRRGSSSSRQRGPAASAASAQPACQRPGARRPRARRPRRDRRRTSPAGCPPGAPRARASSARQRARRGGPRRRVEQELLGRCLGARRAAQPARPRASPAPRARAARRPRSRPQRWRRARRSRRRARPPPTCPAAAGPARATVVERQRARRHRRLGKVLQHGDPPEQVVQRAAAELVQRLVQHLRVAAERAAPPRGVVEVERRQRRRRLGAAQQRGAQRRRHRGAGRLVRVQLEHVLVEPDVREPVVHDVERRRLLGHEQDGLPVRDQLGDHVRDRLALAGAGRAVHHERAALARGGHALALGGVGVEDRDRLLGRERVVQRRLGNRREVERSPHPRRPRGERADDRMRGDQLEVLAQVAVHRLLVEGERRQHDALLDRPRRMLGDRRADRAQQRRDLQRLLGVQLRQLDPEVVLELEPQRRVDERLLLGRQQLPDRARPRGLQPHRHQQQRAVLELRAAVGGVGPVQDPDAQVQDPDAAVHELARRAPRQPRARRAHLLARRLRGRQQRRRRAPGDGHAEHAPPRRHERQARLGTGQPGEHALARPVDDQHPGRDVQRRRRASPRAARR